tara:strand:- start:20136 stop:20558 length:423 start_codon:yes stop_codon:yes gene_type:complete
MSRKVTIQGEEFPSVTAAAKALSVSRNTIVKMLNSAPSSFSIEIDGRLVTSRREAASLLGIPYPTFCSRVSAGWSQERLVQSRSFQRRDQPININGVDYPTITTMLVALDIDQSGFNTLKRECGLSSVEAVDVMLARKVA